MKNLIKIACLFCFLSLTTITSYSQTKLFNGLKGLNEFVDLIDKFITSGNSVDSSINKDKLNSMINEFYWNVHMIIRDKEEIVYRINNNRDYSKNIVELQHEMNQLISTLQKYNNLVQSVGINAEDLEFDLQQDFLNPAKTIDDAKSLFDNPSVDHEKVKETMLIYFTTCIHTMELAEFRLAEYQKQNKKK
jgi:hypothetical protein